MGIRTRGAAVLIVAALCLSLAGCGASTNTSGPNDEMVRAVSSAAAQQTANGNEPAIHIDTITVEESGDRRAVTVRASLDSAADGTDAAFRASEFGSLLVPAIMSNPAMSSVRLVFNAQGSPLVDATYSREAAGAVDWKAAVSVVRDRSKGWVRFFKSASTYSWLDEGVWRDITSSDASDTVSPTDLPRTK